MTPGLTLFTLVHVIISLVGIVSGLVVMLGLLAGKRFDTWTTVFLIFTVATSVTGFLFPFHEFLPSHTLGIISLLVLTIAILARYKYRLANGWRRTYVISAMIALYLNVFVLIVQLFRKVPVLTDLAPTQSEPPFLAVQIVVMVLFGALTIAASNKFRNGSIHNGSIHAA